MSDQKNTKATKVFLCIWCSPERDFLLGVLKTIYSRRYLRILGRSPPVKVSYIQQGCKRQKIKEAHYGPP